ncbi:MAG TPA: choice-of-anchor Q domain-containing protein [Azospirillaceae bacterium]|nr:choice-of-anchor Q domain-containing protein [Azospirillaceae bacterium]
MATYYVNNAVSSSGNGTSWSSAWKSFANIPWSSVKPGDTIYVSGGSSGRTYTETLNVGASGAAGAPITIAKSTEPGHNGPVVIDGQNSRYYGVVVNGRNHVEIENFSIRNHSEAGVSVKYATAGVVIENNDVYSGDPGGGNARGFDVRNSSGVVVRNNSYGTPTNTAAQTDGIWSSNNNGVVFENNRIVISNSNTNGHSDGIQSYLDYNITVRNNWIEQANTATTDNHGMWLSDTRNGGVLKVYNNVVYAPNLTRDSVVTHWAEPSWAENGTIKLWSNTIYGGSRAVNLDKTPNAEVKDNIIIPAAGGVGVHMVNGTVRAGNIDNNLIWAPNGYVASVNGSTKSWSGWQALGYDTHGVNADPKFTNLAGKVLTLSSVSPAIDKGIALSEVVVDFLGVKRPQGAAYDIGAFETVGTGGGGTDPGTPPPPPPSNPYGYDPAKRDAVPATTGLPGDTAYKSTTYTLQSWQENLVQTGTGHIYGTGNSANNILIGNAGSNGLSGEFGDDRLYGGAGDDRLHGGSGNDWLWGGTGNDMLAGNAGRDMLVGGSGADRFVLTSASQSRPGATNRDVILDFVTAEGDRLDISAIDANPYRDGNQAFAFIGRNAFTGSAGQLHLVSTSTGLVVEGDLNGDRVADFQVELYQVSDISQSAIAL